MNWVEELVEEYEDRDELEEFYARTVAPVENSETWESQRHYPFSEKIGYLAEDTLVRDTEIKHDRGEAGFMEKDKKEFQRDAEFRMGHDPVWRYDSSELNSSIEIRMGPENQDAPAQGNLAYMRGESIWQKDDQLDQLATNDRIRQKLVERAENLDILANNNERIETMNPTRYNGQVLEFHITQNMDENEILQTYETLDQAAQLMDNF